MTPLACTVRGCDLPLRRELRKFVCEAGHSYDVARSGYVNLLQPQDRRSLSAGDSRDVVDARARLFTGGVGRKIQDGLLQRIGELNLPERAPVVDVGAGTGDMLGSLAAMRPIVGVGIDLSTAAAGHAARRFPSLTWVVANADRRLPIVDERVALVMSLHGRRHPAECARVLLAQGTLLLAIPAADDLIELRDAVQGRGLKRDRCAALITEHDRLFKLVDRFSFRDRPTLERDLLIDLLRITYRGGRTSASDRIARLTHMTVTLASDVFVFAPRKRRRSHVHFSATA